VQFDGTVPAVGDRIVQAAVKIVIEPIFEAAFDPCSFGFRPRRSAHDALQVLIDECWRGKRWVVETDIASCFEEIPHDRLMAAIEERIVDRKLLRLLRAMLRAGVMQEGAITRSDTGTPQGGVVSPLLANVYLDRLDRAWRTHGRGTLVRYADDLVVMCHSEDDARDALDALRGVLAALGLRLKQAKTRSCTCAKEARALTSSASSTATCAAAPPARGTSPSSRAGLRARRRSAPATASET